mgnify:CR=1 FL=1
MLEIYLAKAWRKTLKNKRKQNKLKLKLRTIQEIFGALVLVHKRALV